ERGKAEVKRMAEALTKNENLRVEAPILPIFEGGMINQFKVIEVPGHSIDQIALYNQMTGELIAGDHVLEHAPRSDLVEVGFDGDMLQSLYVYGDSQKRCQILPLNRIYPDRGTSVEEKSNELFTERLNWLARERKLIKEAL